jgi:5'-nucleotidase
MKWRWFLVFSAMALSVQAREPLVILHTNDVHSQLEPNGPSEGKYAHLGGVVERNALIRLIRHREPNVLVVDAGDFVQGSAYFNLFRGEAEVAVMNAMGLDAVTLGNHEFDNGVKALAEMLKRATFPVVCSNYDVSGTPLKKVVRPWLVLRKGKLRVGVVSANVAPHGLIAEKQFKGIRYQSPLVCTDSIAGWLKREKKCDVVVCLSHLGLEAESSHPDDRKLASGSKYIDVIVGGHSHTLLPQGEVRLNALGKPVVIGQAGKWGAYLGRIDLSIEP